MIPKKEEGTRKEPLVSFVNSPCTRRIIDGVKGNKEGTDARHDNCSKTTRKRLSPSRVGRTIERGTSIKRDNKMRNEHGAKS